MRYRKIARLRRDVMSLNLESLLPPHNYRIDSTGDLERWVNLVLQPVLDLLWAEHLRWRDQVDVDLANEDSVDAMLADLGNPFSIALSIASSARARTASERGSSTRSDTLNPARALM